jgi:hypothetical protein
VTIFAMSAWCTDRSGHRRHWIMDLPIGWGLLAFLKPIPPWGFGYPPRDVPSGRPKIGSD